MSQAVLDVLLRPVAMRHGSSSAVSLIVLAADTVGQHFLPMTLPVGVVTAAVGAPYFLFLLYRANLRI